MSQQQQLLYRQRLLDAAAQHHARGKATFEVECPWFTIEAGKTRKLRELVGSWSEGVDPANVDDRIA